MEIQTPTPFENSELFANGLLSSLTLEQMIARIEELSTEPMQDAAWEAIASVLIHCQPVAEA
jgi:hypothetical protein